MNNVRSKVALPVTIAILLGAILTTTGFTSATHNVFAYSRNQATSQANECGNGQIPTNIGCQNTDCQIQGDENACALTSQQTFPSVVREVPTEPPTTETTLFIIKHVNCGEGVIPCPAESAFGFSLLANGVDPEDVFPGALSPGTKVSLLPGDYAVAETQAPKLPPGQVGTTTKSADCSGTISEGQTKTCTFTNTITSTGGGIG